MDLKPVALVLVASCAPAAHAPHVAPPPSPPSLDRLEAGHDVQGFVTTSLYVDDDDRPRGARFIHSKTHFVFDYLRIESAPQAFVYVTTYPTSDKGEPHTQEHLLLGKGNKGRFLGNYEHVTLTQSSAFTAQYRTAYHFHTLGEGDVFWGVMKTELDALLHPDYSDEEIRREVRHFGVSKAGDGALALDEKGTVYNEMVRTFEAANTIGWYELGRMLYGPTHPLALSSGGTPEGIRALLPEDIRRFHAEHYRLGNMGMIGAFPASVPLGTVLTRVGAILDALAGPGGAPPSDVKVPPARSDQPPGALRLVEYPHATVDQPGPLYLAWPATRSLDLGDRILLSLFLSAFAGDEGSTMYKLLVDRATRAVDVGATSVWSWVSPEIGQPIYFGLDNVGVAHANEAGLAKVREVTSAALAALAALPDGSPELAAFDARVKARITEMRRDLDKQLDTPPGFGIRATSDAWIQQLDDLSRTPGFRKSLTLRSELARAEALVDAPANPWRERLRAWGLFEVPFGLALRASPALRARIDEERSARRTAELTRLAAAYGAPDPSATLARHQAEIDRGTEEITRAEASVPMPPFLSSPPMTLDDALVYKTETRGGIPVVATSFETMKSATVGIALRLDTVPEELLPYLAILPRLMSDVGVVHDGVPVRYDEVRDRLRREILGLSVYLSTSFAQNRAELVIEASGNDAAETRRALGWMRDVLAHPDWRPENLPRLRDVVEESAASLHNTTLGSEEHWAQIPAQAYWRQERPLLAHAGSFLTRTHDVFRLGWMLEAPSDPAAFARFMDVVASAGKRLDRAKLARLAGALAGIERAPDTEPVAPSLRPYVLKARALPAALRAPVAKAGRDLALRLGDLPDDALANDWASLCAQMGRDAASAIPAVLEAFARALGSVRRAGNARAWIVGSPAHQQAVQSDVDALLGALDPTPAPTVTYASRRAILARAAARSPAPHDTEDHEPAFVAFVNPSTSGAALVNTAPSIVYTETKDDALVDFLAANVFSGTGGHSFYKRVWGAGLAYSAWIATWPRQGRLGFYADRCADVTQTLRFVAGEIERAPRDPRFVDYAVARAFDSRLALSYEARASAIAVDQAEAIAPEQIRAFRTRILALRDHKGLEEAMHARFKAVYAPVIPTLGPLTSDRDTVRLLIGPASQIDAYESYLRTVHGDAVRVVRLYPRDFWDVDDARH